MAFSVNSEKSSHYTEDQNFWTNPTPSVNHLLRFDVGSVISNFPAVPVGKIYGKLHYRALEKEKQFLLKENASNYK